MNKMKQAGTLAALVGALCATGTARADGLFAAPQYYLGVHAGATNGDGTAYESLSNYFSIAGDKQRTNLGVLAGVNFRNGAWLYGVEADYGHMGDQEIESCVGGGAPYTRLCETKSNYHLRARVGYRVNNIDLFVTGGFAGTKARIYVPDYGPNAFEDKTLNGYTIGAGADITIGEHGMLRLEALKDKYDGKAYSVDNYYGVSDWEDLTVRAAAIFTF